MLLLSSEPTSRKNKTLQSLWAESIGISADSEFLGGDIKKQTVNAIIKLNKFHTAINDKSIINEAFIKDLYDSLYAVIESTAGIEEHMFLSKDNV